MKGKLTGKRAREGKVKMKRVREEGCERREQKGGEGYDERCWVCRNGL